MFFDPQNSKLIGKVNAESLGILVNATIRLFSPEGTILQRELRKGSLNLDEQWHQIYTPHPVVHWLRQNDGYLIEVHDAANGQNPNGPSRNSAKLVEYLQYYASNGNGKAL